MAAACQFAHQFDIDRRLELEVAPPNLSVKFSLLTVTKSEQPSRCAYLAWLFPARSHGTRFAVPFSRDRLGT
jgi:hypothetical protein